MAEPDGFFKAPECFNYNIDKFRGKENGTARKFQQTLRQTPDSQQAV